jgi:hypothetical protein
VDEFRIQNRRIVLIVFGTCAQYSLRCRRIEEREGVKPGLVAHVPSGSKVKCSECLSWSAGLVIPISSFENRNSYSKNNSTLLSLTYS